MLKDYYAVLGVPETADADAIKKAYRQMARDYHPDRNAGDKAAEEKFKDAQEAYDTLSDPEKRKAYDLRRNGPRSFDDVYTGAGGRFRTTPDGTGYSRYDPSGFDFEDGGGSDFFGRIFGGAFGGGPQPRYETPPRDTEASVSLSFDEALAGGPREYQIDGEAVRITIPKGVANGFKIKLAGRGQRGARGKRSDLYITFNVSDSPRFRREGDNLTVTETLSAFDAMLGTARTVTTAYGKNIRVTIPPGTQPGERLRLRGQGVQKDGGVSGDLFVEIAVTIPKLTAEQRERLEAVRGEIGG